MDDVCYFLAREQRFQARAIREVVDDLSRRRRTRIESDRAVPVLGEQFHDGVSEEAACTGNQGHIVGHWDPLNDLANVKMRDFEIAVSGIAKDFVGMRARLRQGRHNARGSA